jgi:hypothetical protein
VPPSSQGPHWPCATGRRPGGSPGRPPAPLPVAGLDPGRAFSSRARIRLAGLSNADKSCRVPGPGFKTRTTHHRWNITLALGWALGWGRVPSIRRLGRSRSRSSEPRSCCASPTRDTSPNKFAEKEGARTGGRAVLVRPRRPLATSLHEATRREGNPAGNRPGNTKCAWSSPGGLRLGSTLSGLAPVQVFLVRHGWSWGFQLGGPAGRPR